MKIHGFIFILLFGLVQSQDKCDKARAQNGLSRSNINNNMRVENKASKYDRLPDGVLLTDEVREEIKNEKGEISYQIIGVGEKLKDLGAKFEGETLVDRNGLEIRFYRPPIRGTSQGFEEDQKQNALDDQALRELKGKYTVIILYVNPLKVM